jgi:type I restriction enzyme M protein
MCPRTDSKCSLHAELYNGDPFEEKMKNLTTKFEEQFIDSAKREKAIRRNLKGLGYGG